MQKLSRPFFKCQNGQFAVWTLFYTELWHPKLAASHPSCHAIHTSNLEGRIPLRISLKSRKSRKKERENWTHPPYSWIYDAVATRLVALFVALQANQTHPPLFMPIICAYCQAFRTKHVCFILCFHAHIFSFTLYTTLAQIWKVSLNWDTWITFVFLV